MQYIAAQAIRPEKANTLWSARHGADSRASTRRPIAITPTLPRQVVIIGKLTTHVLDTANGCPAAGIAVTLTRLDPGEEALLSIRLDADGRATAPLLEGDALRPGRYRLTFATAEYFRAKGATLVTPPFLDLVPIEFAIADAGAHYHVPLLVSPWSYSTYRGS